MALFGSDRDSRIYEAIKSYNRNVYNPVQGSAELDILRNDQNQFAFTGERLVINDDVKTRYSNVLEEHLARYMLACKLVKGLHVLDAACGTGYGAKMMEAAGAERIVGLDISEESIRLANSVYAGSRIAYHKGDVHALPFPAGSFDAVVSFETIEHIPDGAAWVKESARVLKSKGIFIVSTPNRNVTNAGLYFCEQPINPHHRFEYTITEFTGELLKEYDILELYGQTFVNDTLHAGVQMLRQVYFRDLHYVPKQLKTTEGHNLVPLSDIKNATPAFVVAVCRKKA